MSVKITVIFDNPADPATFKSTMPNGKSHLRSRSRTSNVWNSGRYFLRKMVRRRPHTGPRICTSTTIRLPAPQSRRRKARRTRATRCNSAPEA